MWLSVLTAGTTVLHTLKWVVPELSQQFLLSQDSNQVHSIGVPLHNRDRQRQRHTAHTELINDEEQSGDRWDRQQPATQIFKHPKHGRDYSICWPGVSFSWTFMNIALYTISLSVTHLEGINKHIFYLTIQEDNSSQVCTMVCIIGVYSKPLAIVSQNILNEDPTAISYWWCA